ncbi:MAG: hypothetical protein IJ468_13750 [Lachnospiraceae bacterium]|nr:hypothetical protein [Lachnospiraceae bacterium]
MNYENPIRQYLSEVSSYLVCPLSSKKRFLSSLQQQIEEFADTQDSEVSYEVLVSQFGEPKDIATCFLQQSESRTIRDMVSGAMVKKRVCLVVTAVLLIVAIAVVAYTRYLAQDTINGSKIRTYYNSTLNMPSYTGEYLEEH